MFVFLIIFRFLDIESLQTYGAAVDQVVAPLGEAITQSALEEALSKKKYKLVTFTHVDTSTGVLSDAKMIGETVKRISPETLVRSVLSISLSFFISYAEFSVSGNSGWRMFSGVGRDPAGRMEYRCRDVRDAEGSRDSARLERPHG